MSCPRAVHRPPAQTLDFDRGEFVAVVGRSGSDETTLVNLLAGIDRPGSGEVSPAGALLGSLSESLLTKWRGRAVRLVFQFSLTATDGGSPLR